MSGDARLVGLDTSFVLRLLVGEPAAQARRAVARLDTLRDAGKRCAVSDLVVSEAYSALQYHYGVPKQRALDTLRAFLESPEVVPLGAALTILQQPDLARARPGFVDRLIHAWYAREAATLLSFEKTAAKLPGTTVL